MWVGHCLDLIRQQLMCQADTTMFGTMWFDKDGLTTIIPDFNHAHRCRDFDAIRDWAREHQNDILPPHSVPDEGDLVLQEWP